MKNQWNIAEVKQSGTLAQELLSIKVMYQKFVPIIATGLLFISSVASAADKSAAQEIYQGGDSGGGGHKLNGKLVEDAENEGTVPFDVTKESAYKMFVRTNLNILEEVLPEVGVIAKRALTEREWLIEPKKLKCQPVKSMVDMEGAEAVACQDEFDIRISKQDKETLGSEQLGKLYLHEILRYVKWELQPVCMLEIPSVKARCEKEIRKLTNVLILSDHMMPGYKERLKDALKKYRFEAAPTITGEMRSNQLKEQDQNADLLGNLDATKITCQVKMPEWDEQLEFLYPKRDEELRRLRDQALPVMLRNAKAFRTLVEQIKERMSPELWKQMRAYARHYQAQKKDYDAAKDEKIKEMLRKALVAVGVEYGYISSEIIKIGNQSQSDQDHKLMRNAGFQSMGWTAYISNGKVVITQSVNFQDPNWRKDIDVGVRQGQYYQGKASVRAEYDFISKKWIGAPDTENPAEVSPDEIDRAIETQYYLPEPGWSTFRTESIVPTQVKIDEIETNDLRGLCQKLEGKPILKAEASSSEPGPSVIYSHINNFTVSPVKALNKQ